MDHRRSIKPMKTTITLTLLSTILLVVTLTCRSTPTDPVAELVSRPMPSWSDTLEMAVGADTLTDNWIPPKLPPGRGIVHTVYGCPLGSNGTALVTTNGPMVNEPWLLQFQWPRTGGRHFLLLSSKLDPRPLVAGCTLVGPTEWVLELTGIETPTDTYTSLAVVTPPMAASGSQWWLQLLWWDGVEVSVSGGYWFRVGNLP
jgi:hypothetical protein